MSECSVSQDSGCTWIHIQGRVDSMTSPAIQQQVSATILDGARRLVLDMEKVSYVSSAGLRVFMLAQKQLQKAGGEILIYKISDAIREVFQLSGFDRIFTIVSSREEILPAGNAQADSPAIVSREVNGIALQYVQHEGAPGALRVIGSQEKLARAGYTEQDVITLGARDLQFGTGLATPGGQDEEYLRFFGESVLLNGNFFFYPAVKRPAVDFLLSAGPESRREYKFLHGFSFSGSYDCTLSFDHTDGFLPLADLLEALFSISTASVLGVVLLAESKGLWGMHLKKVPLQENAPPDGRGIFDAQNFTEWMNFPVEPADINNIIAGAGIAVRERSAASPPVQSLLAKDSSFHLHAGVFARQPLSRNIAQFEHELNRVVTELDVYRVQHLLGQSLLSSGMVGIIELEPDGIIS
ncbi:STAS domain-containing protein [Thermodesulfobacteriota bacterium]